MFCCSISKFHLSEVQGTVMATKHLKLIPSVNNDDRMYRKAVTFQRYPPDFHCWLINRRSSREVIQIVNHTSDRGDVECLRESGTKYVHRQ